MDISTLKLIVRHFGVGWIAYRGWKSISEKFGYWKFKLPSRSWDHFGSSAFGPERTWQSADEFFERRKLQGVHFFFDPGTLVDTKTWLQSLDPNDQWATDTASRIEAGEFEYFSSRWINIGAQPDWFLNPYDNLPAPSGQHFSEIDEFGFGDVKTIWEASRFGFVFHLARSFARTGDLTCAETYWRLMEHWMDANPPYDGINWKCGQESGLRFLAAVFGLHVFANCPATNIERLERFIRFAAATGNRIEKHISYAISQKNNHGISEAVALWTIGTLFPDLRPAKKWRARGLAVLKQLCLELIYEDGAFSQHSANYHRLVLHLLAWTVRLAQVNQVELDPKVAEKFKQATHFIGSLVSDSTGAVPRYGSDDGAMILPLNHCDYSDFRPVVQLCRTIVQQPVRFPKGNWNEDLFWFGLPIDQTVRVAESDSPTDQIASIQSFPHGGIHRLTKGQTTATIRAGSFRHRPAQSDMMHVDIVWKGNNIAIDPGTYTYNGKQHWKNIPFNRNQQHNSIIIDSIEPQSHVSRFMLLPWNEAELVSEYRSSDAVGIEWKRTVAHQLSASVVHHRALILLPENKTLVLDALWSKQSHDFTISWLLGGKLNSFDRGRNKVSMQAKDQPFCVEVAANQELSSNYVIGDSDSARGWFSPRYLELEPAISLRATATAKNLIFQTLLGPDGDPTSDLKTDSLLLALPKTAQPYCLLDSDCVQTTLRATTR